MKRLMDSWTAGYKNKQTSEKRGEQGELD